MQVSQVILQFLNGNTVVASATGTTRASGTITCTSGGWRVTNTAGNLVAFTSVSCDQATVSGPDFSNYYSTLMDVDLKDLITGISIHPKKPNLLAVGVGDAIRYIEHDTKKNTLYETRSIEIGNYAKGLTFSADGSQVFAITSDKEMRIFDFDLNLKRRYNFSEEASSIGQPFVDKTNNSLGIDVFVGFDSGKLQGYDSRTNSNQPVIKLENHSNALNVIKSTDWWGCVTAADDGYIVLNDFRSKKYSKKSEYGPLEGLPRDICICPFSKKTVVCTYECVYAFKSNDFEFGPVLKSGPAYKDKMPASVLNLSTHERPDLFGISYVDSTYITLLDTARHMWVRRYATKHNGLELFAFPERKTHGYVYFSGEDSYLCVRKMDDVRENCDQILNFKATTKDKLEEKKMKVQLKFPGLVDEDDSMEGDEGAEESFEELAEDVEEEEMDERAGHNGVHEESDEEVEYEDDDMEDIEGA
uniref:Uncharacterized protein n=1 Tax=Panagrolaimus sp. JU765 TaxID=591449 RepID=A0AC34R2M2_9BILA